MINGVLSFSFFLGTCTQFFAVILGSGKHIDTNRNCSDYTLDRVTAATCVNWPSVYYVEGCK